MNCIGVIGLGSISNRHRQNIRQIFKKATIIVAPSNPLSTKKNIQNYDIYESDFKNLLKHRLDFVIVASPSTFHLNHAEPFIRANIPLLIEKPIAASAKDATALLQLIEQYQSRVAVGYCLRFLPSAIKAREVIQKQMLGSIYNIEINSGSYLPNWRPGIDYKNSVSASQSLGGGALLELSHELDYYQWIFGNLTIDKCYLRSSSELGLGVEDVVDIIGRDSMSNSQVHIHLDFLQKEPIRLLKVLGSKGAMEWNIIDNTVRVRGEKSLQFDYNTYNFEQIYADELIAFSDSDESRIASANESTDLIKLIETIKKTGIYLNG
jgi:predicted dehydrogenase